MKIYNRIIKRFFDLFFAFFALVILLPIMISVSIIIKCTSKGPIIFKQIRMGYEEKEFYMYKFRTLSVDTPPNLPTRELENSNLYINSVGRILRKTSIDELPQLINIIKGDMSFIGPRPVILEEKELISKRKEYGVYKVRPGLSGLAQVNGRDLVDLDNKVKWDRYYVDNISFLLDLKIFFETVFYVLSFKDVREGKIES